MNAETGRYADPDLRGGKKTFLGLKSYPSMHININDDVDCNP